MTAQTPEIDLDKVEMPVSFTIDMCEGTADAVQYRIDRAIERDGSLDAARTGAGMGFGFSLMTQIVATLQNAAKDLASLRAQLSAATERADIFEGAADRYRNAMKSARSDLEAANARAEKAEAERDDYRARLQDAAEKHHESDATLATYRALIEKAVEALEPVAKWFAPDLKEANELQADLYAYDDNAEVDMSDIRGDAAHPLLWGDLRKLASSLADLTAAIGKGEGA